MPQRHLIFVLIRFQHAPPSPEAICLLPWKKPGCTPQEAALQDPAWQEVSCEIRTAGYAGERTSPEPRYILFAIGVFRFLGYWYEHRAPAQLSAKRRTEELCAVFAT